jgi:hypothetical protein
LITALVLARPYQVPGTGAQVAEYSYSPVPVSSFYVKSVLYN